MIELDKRIISGKKPLTAFDEIGSKFIGTECYFSDDAIDFGNVVLNCQKGILLSIGEVTGLFNATKNNSYANFNYCLPSEWVKESEPEPKYRPFTMNEFKATFKIYKILTLRRINEPDNIYTMGYLGYRQYDESDSEKNHIYLTNGEFTLKGLFNNFEIYSSEGWKPFGVKE